MRMATPGPGRLRGGGIETASLSLVSVGRPSESTDGAAWSGSVDDSDRTGTESSKTFAV